MNDDNVVSLRRPDDRAEDPLTEVLRHGARRLLAQAIEAEVATFLEATPIWSMRRAAGVWSATASCPSAPSRPASARCRCASLGCATVVRRPPTPGSGSPRR